MNVKPRKWICHCSHETGDAPDLGMIKHSAYEMLKFENDKLKTELEDFKNHSHKFHTQITFNISYPKSLCKEAK